MAAWVAAWVAVAPTAEEVAEVMAAEEAAAGVAEVTHVQVIGDARVAAPMSSPRRIPALSAAPLSHLAEVAGHGAGQALFSELWRDILPVDLGPDQFCSTRLHCDCDIIQCGFFWSVLLSEVGRILGN